MTLEEGCHTLPPFEERGIFALTDQHVLALERAIRAEGYDIHYDTSTGEFKLERKS